MTVSVNVSKATEIRSQLGYPIVDCDGHILELLTVFVEHIRDLVPSSVVERFEATPAYQRWNSPWALSAEERRRTWSSQNNLWGWPTKNTLDRATATLPKLYAERMDSLGIDYSILYPSAGLFLVTLPDEEMRDEIIRAYNKWVLDLSSPFSDRMTGVAIIPMHTPNEAIAHLHAAKEMGHKVICMQGYVQRPIASIAEKIPAAATAATRLDYFGLDSEYDYDPVWQTCADLKLSPTFHSPSGLRAGRSVSNYTYNHIGSIAQAQDGLAKSLFLGGVTRRFPTLNFGFLECGAAWACSLLSTLAGHLHKRSLEAMAYVDPAALDIEALMGYIERYGDEVTLRHLDAARSFYDRDFPSLPDRDDFWMVAPKDEAEVVDLFVPRFYIGCEADDPSVAWAFNTKINPRGSKVRATFGSDVGHWDVTDVADVVVEAWELVEHELISEQDFKEFMFWNPVELHAGTNPDFFTGTRVESDVAAFLKAGRTV
jgi:predicted TIM-barrel fold metal-dependent hydrolase